MCCGASIEAGLVVTIDGGAATGKSTTARGVAAALRLLHVDSGSHYRALTLYAVRQGLAADDWRLAKELASLELGTVVREGRAFLTLNGAEPADAELRSDGVNAVVSAYAAEPTVRAKLKAYQRGQCAVARQHGLAGVVMEGRDIGTVIFPEAAHKFYLVCDDDARTRRRAAEGKAESVVERDRKDSSRQAAPLKQPEGAAVIDTGPLTPAEVVARIVARVRGGA